jgi:hypothetical protein
LDLRGRKWWEAREDCIMRSFITCTLHQILLGLSVRWEEHVARVGKPKWKRPLGMPGINLKETGRKRVDWMHLAHIGTCGWLL